jgi:hypothetical protein
MDKYDFTEQYLNHQLLPNLTEVLIVTGILHD